MRDTRLMSRTLLAMRDNGGVAMQRDCGLDRYAWFAGDAQLNAQAMHDLISDGWVRLLHQYGLALIDTWPLFADHLLNEETAHG